MTFKSLSLLIRLSVFFLESDWNVQRGEYERFIQSLKNEVANRRGSVPKLTRSANVCYHSFCQYKYTPLYCIATYYSTVCNIPIGAWNFRLWENVRRLSLVHTLNLKGYLRGNKTKGSVSTQHGIILLWP